MLGICVLINGPHPDHMGEGFNEGDYGEDTMAILRQILFNSFGFAPRKGEDHEDSTLTNKNSHYITIT